MSRINRLPFGLQDFLQSKTDGENPGNLNQDVVPTIDMLRWYDATAHKFHSTVENVVTEGEFDQVTVPVGEIWFVVAVGVNCRSALAGNGSDFSCAVKNVTGASNPNDLHILADFPRFESNSVAAVSQPFGLVLPEVVPVTGSESISWRANNTVSGAGTVLAIGTLRYIPVSI